MSNIIIEKEKCTGCRACEIACSYHHKKIFNPRISSIDISRSVKEGSVSITIYRDLEINRTDHLLCDDCVTESNPLCVKYCDTGALALEWGGV